VYDSNRPGRFDAAISVGSAAETVTVTASAGVLNTETSQLPMKAVAKKDESVAPAAPSVNVANLQRLVAGVLPIRVDVPHAGNAYRFVRPLVIDEETNVTFKYKTTK
jgi:hypothetical protein